MWQNLDNQIIGITHYQTQPPLGIVETVSEWDTLDLTYDNNDNLVGTPPTPLSIAIQGASKIITSDPENPHTKNHKD